MKIKYLRLVELALLFFVGPVLYASKLISLAPVFFFGLYLLLAARELVTHSWREETRSLSFLTLALLALLPALGLGLLSLLSGHLEFVPLSARILIFYPLVSVIPQELIYRVAFFSRYRDTIKNPLLLIFINALAFSILHTIYMNPFALGLTFIGGLFYAYLRIKGASLYELIILHTLHGLTLFWVGLGQFFYINLFVPPNT